MTSRNTGTPSISISDIAVEGVPDAPTIVFVHGAGISRQMWRPQLETLSESFQVASFDLPGHGTRAGTPFTFKRAVASLAAVVADLSPPVVLVGHSLGGYVVMEYAARNPDDVVGLVCSGSSADYRGILGIRTRLTAALYRIGGRLPPIDRWFQNRTASQIRTLPISEATAEAIIDDGFYLHSWGQAGSALAGRDFGELLRTFGGPVLLVNGETDSLNVPDAERLAASLTGVETTVIEDAGHLCNLQAPSEYTATVREFVETCLPELHHEGPP